MDTLGKHCTFPTPTHKLVIAEKPAVGQSLAAVLGASEKKKGYLEGNGWIVSWCLGHLADFIDAEGYNPKYAKWRREDLPILPEEWKFGVGENRCAQFAILRRLPLREDVSETVNACDAGREGELVFRTVYNLSGCHKSMKRLWISSMEEDAIREGFQNLKPGADYDSLYEKEPTASVFCHNATKFVPPVPPPVCTRPCFGWLPLPVRPESEPLRPSPI